MACGERAAAPEVPPHPHTTSPQPDAALAPSGPVRLVPQVGFGDHAEIDAVDVSQDGRLALAASKSGGVEVWDLGSNLLVRALSATANQRVGLARFLGRGERVVTLSGADLVVVDVASGDTVGTLKVPDAGRGGPTQVAASADGAVVLAGYARELVVWQVEGFALRQRIALDRSLEAMALDREGKRALTAHREPDGSRIVVWDVATGRRGLEVPVREADVEGLAFGRDGKHALGWDNRAAILWDVTSGNERRRFEHQGSLRAAALSPDGRRVLGATTEGMFLWDAQSGARLRHMRSGSNFAAEVVFMPDGRRAVAGGSLEPMWINDLESGELERKLELGWGEGAESVALAAGGRALVASRNGLAVWDLHGLRLATMAGENFFRPSSMALTPDGKQALLAGHAAEFYPIEGGRGAGFRSGRMGVEAVALSLDGSRVATAGIMDREAVQVFAASGGDALWKSNFDDEETVDAIAFSPDGKELVTLHDDLLTVWDATSGTIARQTPLKQTKGVMTASPTSAAVAVCEEGRVSLRSIATGAVERTFATSAEARVLAFSRDGRSLAVAGAKGVEIFDAASGARRIGLSGSTGPVVSLGFSPDGRYLACGSSAGITRLHALEAKGQPAISLLTRGKEWLVYADDGYFDASPDGTGLLALVQGTRAYRPDQLAYRLNRPDILLRRMGLGSAVLVASLEGRHERRLRKAGVSSLALSQGLAVPEARIVSQSLRKKELVLDFECNDAHSEIARYHVFADGVAVYGMRGKAAPSGSKRRFRARETIALKHGDNAIEVSCVNRQGGESLRAHTVARREGTTKPAVYFLGFGVSRYRDRRLDLAYAHADAEALAQRFEKLKPGYRVHTKVYRDGEVTKANIRRAKSFLARAGVDDIVVLFIAGHGVHARDRARTYYFATHDVNVKKLSTTAADFELIEALLDGIGARRKLFLMDTCQSGEDSEGLSLMPGEGARGLRMRNVRALELEGGPAPRPRGGPKAWIDAPRFLDNDLRRRSGAVVLSSSRGNEPSFENDVAKHGVFTAALLEAFEPRRADRDFSRNLTIDELLRFVSQRVAEATGNRQHPVIDRDNPQLDLRLPIEP
jgi:WD40 repeat protein